MSFPCTKCGQCCMNISKVEQLIDDHSGNGICIFYRENVGCKIYQNRPDVCRIDEGYIKFFSSHMSIQEFYQKNAQVCNQLQEEKGMNQQYRVVL